MKIFIDNKATIVDGSAKRTPQGYLMLDAIISRSGKQEYYAIELGLYDRNPMDVIIIDRPVVEVVDSASVSSFINMPVTDEHPPDGSVTPDNFRKYTRGTVLDAESTGDDKVKASMVIHDAELIRKIDGGKKELSAGYAAEIEFSDDGNSAVQRKIRGNHVAFVDSARCGRECRIFDSMPTEENEPMAKLKIKGVEYEIADSVAPAVVVLVDDNATLTKKLEDAIAGKDKVQALLDASEEELKKKEKEMEDEDDEEEKEKKIQDAAAVRLGVLVQASQLVKDYDPTGKSLVEIKKDVVSSCLSNRDFSDKSDAYIESTFDILVDTRGKKDGSDALTDTFSQHMQDSDGKVLTDSEKARQKKIERSHKAWNKGGEK